VDQPRNPWYDGPEFITQCPIQPGTNFTYEILLSEEEGTIWWHAHSGLDRAGVHGAFIIRPKNKKGSDYPFIKSRKLHKEIPIILGMRALELATLLIILDPSNLTAHSACR
jgi:laccase